jgi:hypothetical protein
MNNSRSAAAPMLNSAGTGETGEAERPARIRERPPGRTEHRGDEEHGAEVHDRRRVEGRDLRTASPSFCPQGDHDEHQSGQRRGGGADDDVVILPGGEWRQRGLLQDGSPVSRALESSTSMGTPGVAAPGNDTGQPPASGWPVDSRGGTRTRDPSTMRRVRLRHRRTPCGTALQLADLRGTVQRRAAQNFAAVVPLTVPQERRLSRASFMSHLSWRAPDPAPLRSAPNDPSPAALARMDRRLDARARRLHHRAAARRAPALCPPGSRVRCKNADDLTWCNLRTGST